MREAIKKNKKIIIVGIVIILILLIGISFAYLTTTLHGDKEYLVRAGTLDLVLNEGNELTLEKCSEIITLLQDTYQNIRNDMYARFLSIRILIKTLSIVACLIVLYLLTHSAFFLYSTPIFMVVALIFAIVSAEYITTQTRKQIVIQLKHYTKAREQLLQYEKIKL